MVNNAIIIKNYIKKYIILKINSGDWKIGKKIYSENQLAIKFNCSRMTARETLRLLVAMGYLTSIKRIGYTVSEKLKNCLSTPHSHMLNADKVVLSRVEKNKADVVLKHLSIDVKTLVIKKQYYKEGKYVSCAFIVINQSLVPLSTYKDFENHTLIESFARLGVAIDSGKVKVNIDSLDIFDESKELGFLGKYPIIYSSMHEEGIWAEKTLRITIHPEIGISYNGIG